MRIGRPAHLTRWLTAAVGVGVAVTVVIVAAPAGASTTVPADLALSGVVTSKSPLGGSVVGIHPGDAVDFKAAPASVSTQGLNSLGVPLGDLLGGLLGQVVGYQVVLHLPAGFPGGARDVRLGACGGAADLKISFPKAGTYNFTWSAYSITVLPLLGCQLNSVNFNGNELAAAGIALNASNQWVGKVVAATDPPAGGLSVQLPGVTVAPKVGPVQLPSVGAPGVNVPTLPVTPPSAGGVAPPGAPAPTPSHIVYQPPGQSVQDKVMPKGYGCCDEGHRADGAGGGGLLQSVGGAVPGNSGNGAQAISGLLPNGHAAPAQSGRPVNLAANKAPAGQMPVLLAILAIIALSLVTATYARLYLLRRNVS